ncbi:4788_t:CDS:2, partial [Ambispora leptoticha]
IEASPNNMTQISSHEVTASSNSSDVDKKEVSNDRDSDYEYDFEDLFDNIEDDLQSEDANVSKDDD